MRTFRSFQPLLAALLLACAADTDLYPQPAKPVNVVYYDERAKALADAIAGK